MAERPFDREIARLAVPAFGALARRAALRARRHGGRRSSRHGAARRPRRGVGRCSSPPTRCASSWPTARPPSVARLLGAGDEREAAHLGVQGMWLAAIVGTSLALGRLWSPPTLVSLFGADGAVAGFALTYFRISLIGHAVPARDAGRHRLPPRRAGHPLATGGRGGLLDGQPGPRARSGRRSWHRGVGASAAATVVVQIGAGLVYLRRGARPGPTAGRVRSLPDPSTLRTLARVGADLMIRTAALASGVHRRDGDRHPAGQDRGRRPLRSVVEIWNLLALGLDALAIAAQAMVGRLLGAARPDEARAASHATAAARRGRRRDARGASSWRRHRSCPACSPRTPRSGGSAAFLLLWVAAQQPVAAVVFVLDGVLIGAGDQRFLAWAMVLASAAFFAVALPILPLGLGIGWVWVAISVLLLVRVTALGIRFAGSRWQVVGAVR